jgi:Tfp pilus assembly protein PilN
LNFLPEDYLWKKTRRRSDVICATLLGVVIGGVAVIAFGMRISVRQLQIQHDAVSWQCAQALRTVQEIKDMRAQQEAVARQAETTAAIMQKIPPSCILSEIARALPEQVTLSDLSYGASDDGTSPDLKLKLNGNASSDAQVSETISQLRRSKLFSTVDRSPAPFTSMDGNVHQFQLEVALNPNADAASDMPQAQSQTVFLNPE